ncbi:hypothetical protein cypCar_00007969 [Cyprinus carpio]|nr:hypothetical protein cypCar_00007969 [Cyprinus carpio]
MASFKPTKVQFLPKLGEKVTEETLYWKNYKSPVQIKEFGAITKIDFSPLPPHNYAVTASTRIHIYGPHSQEPIRSFTRFRDTAYGGSFRGDGKLLVAGSEEGLIRLFDISGRVALRQFAGHSKAVHVTSFLSDGFRVVSGSDDLSCRVWDVPSAVELSSLTEHTDYVRALAPSKLNPDLFVTGGRYVKVWDLLKGGQELVSLKNHHKTVTCACLSSVGNKLLTGSLDRRHQKDKETLTSRRRRGPSYQVFVKGKNFVPRQDDFLVSKPVKQYLRKYDKQLKSFEVSKALDTALQTWTRTSKPDVTVAVIIELNRRGTLKNALAGRNEESLTKILNFLLKHIFDPRFSRPLLMVGDIVLDLYQQVFHESPVVERLLQRLMEVLGREAELQQELLQVLGILDTLFASLTPRKEVMAHAAPPVAQESQLQAA